MEKSAKQQEIEGKLAAWRKLSPAEQIADLDRRLGKGVGATKQRARIQAKLDKQTTKADVATTSTESKERPQRPKRQKKDK